MLEEVCSKGEDGYLGKLEISRINLGSGATRGTKRDDTRTTTYHRRSVSCQKTNTVGGGSSKSRKNRHGGARVNEELSIRQDVLQEDEGGTADLFRNRGQRRS